MVSILKINTTSTNVKHKKKKPLTTSELIALLAIVVQVVLWLLTLLLTTRFGKYNSIFYYIFNYLPLTNN